MTIPALVDRSHYPTLRQSVYLNQASIGLIGQPAVLGMHSFIDDIARHGNLHMSDSAEMKYCDALRSRAAKLFHTTASRIAITASASEMLGQLPFLLPVKPHTSVLAVSSDFPAVTRPWLRQVLHGTVSVRFVDELPNEDLTNTIIDAIDERTGVVAVSSVQYGTGTLVDVSRLTKRTAQVGAFLIVDATQAAGAIRIESNTWGADAVITSGYKWLGGHGGVALTAVSDSVMSGLPILPGWMSAPQPFNFDARSTLFASDARRFTQSTMSYVSIAALTTSIEQLLSLGEDKIEAHARGLGTILVERAREYGWTPFRDIHRADASSNIISLGHSQECGRTIVERLRNKKIICSARGNRLRVSLAPYNDAGDVNSLVEGLNCV